MEEQNKPKLRTLAVEAGIALAIVAALIIITLFSGDVSSFIYIDF